MQYIIYKITNTVNGRYYVGAHSTTDENDSYMGSSKLLKDAIKKHGRANFIKEILEFCNDADHMFSREAEIVNEEFVALPETYNLKLGGRGGKGSKKSEEHKNAIRNSIIEKYKNSPKKVLKKGHNAGRKFPPDSEYVYNLVAQHGAKIAAKMLGVTYDSCRNRYYRYKAFLQKSSPLNGTRFQHSS